MSITIFTPTYNRAHTLPNLYQSLVRQDSNDFEWLIIDDGSTDNTEELIKGWINEINQFKIRYYKTANGGKPRAINKALELVKKPYFLIVDSDDYLTDETVKFFTEKIAEINESKELVAIGIMRGEGDEKPLGNPLFSDKEFIDASNLERKKYRLNFDCNELYKVEVLKKYPFKVWEGEKFSPEEIVFNEIALDGYKVRWYNKVGVISKYLNDGLTVNAFQLVKKNPMGYAMLFNHHLKYNKSFKENFANAYLMVCYSLLGKNLNYLTQSNNKIITLLAFPVGIAVAIRRTFQFRKI